MRVIAGEARSLPLKAPEGLDTRPTTDRIKETLFNILQGDIPGSIFIDLCSGSGSIGIEAISRGAKRAYFVENAAKPAKCIQDNLNFTRFTDRGVLLKQDVVSALGSIHEKEADIIFMDPPYQAGLEAVSYTHLLPEMFLMGMVTEMEILMGMGILMAEALLTETVILMVTVIHQVETLPMVKMCIRDSYIFR